MDATHVTKTKLQQIDTIMTGKYFMDTIQLNINEYLIIHELGEIRNISGEYKFINIEYYFGVESDSKRGHGYTYIYKNNSKFGYLDFGHIDLLPDEIIGSKLVFHRNSICHLIFKTEVFLDNDHSIFVGCNNEFGDVLSVNKKEFIFYSPLNNYLTKKIIELGD